jgi:hypothetical protein
MGDIRHYYDTPLDDAIAAQRTVNDTNTKTIFGGVSMAYVFSRNNF